MGEAKGLLSAAPGTPSANRFVYLFTAILANVMVWGIWAWVSFTNMKLADMPDGVIAIFALSLGIVSAAKVGQKYFEGGNGTTGSQAQSQ